jgi:RNA polymerase sigma-70 factor (ECF subfamily)
MSSDEELMMKAAEGDMDAFEQLIVNHQQGALGVAYRFLGDQTQAEDIVQEAFLKILAAAPGYEPRAKFRTYLFGVIWRLCVDRYRRKRPQRLESSLDPQGSAAEPQQVVLRKEAAEWVREAIGSLPPRQRMAIVLKHYEDLSYQEIARAIKCSPRAVDALLSRARTKLREALRDAI